MAGTTTYYGISYPTSTDYVKDGATAMQTIATGFDSAVAIPTYNNQTGTSYTFVLADTGKTVTSNNASAVTFTIPPQASVAWANNTTLTVRNLGAGVVTIAGGSGVTVTNTAQTVAQYGEVKLIRTASNAWTVVPASGGTSGLTRITTQTFTTSSAVNVNNAFSATYENYKIVLTISDNTNAGNMQYRMRASGTDNTSSVYSYWSVEPNANGSTLYTVVGKSISNGVIGYQSASGDGGVYEFIISRPFSTTPTVISGTYSTTDASNTLVTGFQGNAHRASTSFDGISFIPPSGTISGNVRIYGIEN